MNELEYRDEAARQFRGLKKAADRALAQVSDGDFFAALDPESNSIALIVKHLAGNMRSRFTDFLTSDGEKPDRRRDSEFEIEAGDTRESLLARWEEGWKITAAAIEPLTAEDFSKTVPIRGEPHTLLRAINRQLVHYGYHVGQIVYLAKHFAGPKWETLSIPRGKSEEANKGGR
ncbi:MAG TPA: DUF1572 family protein [Thermoanaerobaculia bacterium]|jgi:hypothetical protein|nr:DUF1572 family protein [Thermoanaerobaculia bacterium]